MPAASPRRRPFAQRSTRLITREGNCWRPCKRRCRRRWTRKTCTSFQSGSIGSSPRHETPSGRPRCWATRLTLTPAKMAERLTEGTRALVAGFGLLRKDPKKQAAEQTRRAMPCTTSSVTTGWPWPTYCRPTTSGLSSLDRSSTATIYVLHKRSSLWPTDCGLSFSVAHDCPTATTIRPSDRSLSAC